MRLGLTPQHTPGSTSTTAGGVGFAPEPPQELLIRKQEVNSCHASPLEELMLHQGLCSAAGQERGVSLEEAWILLGHHQQGLATGRRAGMALAAARASSPLGTIPGAEVLVPPPWLAWCAGGCPTGPMASREPSRDKGLPWRQAPSSRRNLDFFFSPCNPSVLNFFGGFTPNSLDSTANALQSSAQLASAAACNQSRGKGKYQPCKFTNK